MISTKLICLNYYYQSILRGIFKTLSRLPLKSEKITFFTKLKILSKIFFFGGVDFTVFWQYYVLQRTHVCQLNSVNLNFNYFKDSFINRPN